MAEKEKTLREMSCMERAIYEAKKNKEMYGPSNRELMAEIKKLQQQIEALSNQLSRNA